MPIRPFKPPSIGNPPYKKRSASQVLSGRDKDLSKFPFESVNANGVVITASEIRSNPAALAGIMERVSDIASVTGWSAGSPNSPIPTEDLAAWKMILNPEHLVTNNRPRCMVYGHDLKMRTHYRMQFILRLNNVAVTPGWTDKTVPGFYGSIFSLSQQSDTSPIHKFSDGQPTGFVSPFYINLSGNVIYPEFRTISEDMGLFPKDPAGIEPHVRWGLGDTRRSNFKNTPIRVLCGENYNEIIVDFYLDERRIGEGGQGYYRASFNGEDWFEVLGVTAHPPNEFGQYVSIFPRWGQYEVKGSTTATGLKCKNTAAGSCTIDRSIFVRLMSCVEVSE